MNVREQLRGTGVAVITPFTNDNQLDYPALGKLLDFLISNGVDYIVTMGTTGETPVLSQRRKEIHHRIYFIATLTSVYL
jgi:4-hydroxy-tetrahydrodipicolinate synthase